MIRETAVTNQELADLHSDCATNIDKPYFSAALPTEICLNAVIATAVSP